MLNLNKIKQLTYSKYAKKTVIFDDILDRSYHCDILVFCQKQKIFYQLGRQREWQLTLHNAAILSQVMRLQVF